MAHVQLQISRERHRGRGAELDGLAHRHFGTGEIRSSLALGTAGAAVPQGLLSGCHCSQIHSPADGLELRPQRRQAFVVAGLFVVVFVSLVDFWVFLTLPPINMHVQGGILGSSFLMVCLGGAGSSE